MIQRVNPGFDLQIKRISITLVCCLIFFADFAFASSIIPIYRLTTDMKGFDGQRVYVRGEVVGDLMMRGDWVWLNLDDGTDSIGIWAHKEKLPKIDFIGNYKEKGDTVEVEGIFNKACSVHGGETDIHASEIRSICSGQPINHPISAKKMDLALILFVLSIVASFIYFLRNKGQR